MLQIVHSSKQFSIFDFMDLRASPLFSNIYLIFIHKQQKTKSQSIKKSQALSNGTRLNKLVNTSFVLANF